MGVVVVPILEGKLEEWKDGMDQPQGVYADDMQDLNVVTA